MVMIRMTLILHHARDGFGGKEAEITGANSCDRF